MPAKTINMHGKIYSLVDEQIRTKLQAQKFAQEIREQGSVAFLNPAKRKGQETTYYVYMADKSLRVSIKRNLPIETILTEYKKGSESFKKFIKELEATQKPVELVKLAVDELPKQIVKSEVILENLEIPKVKIPVQIITSKKSGTKKNNKKK